MKFDFRMIGIKELQKRLKAVDDDVQRNLNAVAGKISLDAEAELKKVLSQAGTGREYIRTRDKKMHRASAPGKFPAPDFGRLRASVRSKKKIKDRIKEVIISAGSDLVAYAKYLEFGTSRIAPRPFFMVTIRKNTPKWIKWWQQSVARGFRNG